LIKTLNILFTAYCFCPILLASGIFHNIESMNKFPGNTERSPNISIWLMFGYCFRN